MSIKTKLITALSLILVSAFLTTSLINYEFSRRAIRTELLTSSLPLTGKTLYSEIQATMMRPLLVSSAMANNTFLKDWVLSGEQDIDKITSYLKKFHDKYGFFTAFFVSHTTDKYYTQKGVLKEISPRDPHDVWYYAFMRSEKEFDLDVDTNEAENQSLTIFVNFKVRGHDGRFLGIAGVGIKIENAMTLLQKAREKHQREVYLVDEDGMIQVHHDHRLIDKYSITRGEGIRDVAPHILQSKVKPLTHEYDLKGTHFLLSAQYIPELEWYLIVEQSEESALISARNNLVRTLIIGSGTSILIIILCILVVNHFQGRLEKIAQTDPLTNVANRRALEDHFKHSAYQTTRYGTVFSAIIIDLNKFKEVNDTHGHLMGDEVLKRVASILTETIRPTDIVARWGGDEFIILLDGNIDDACALAQRAQTVVSDPSQKLAISFSYGLAQFREGDDLETLTMRADKDLYHCKNNGLTDDL